MKFSFAKSPAWFRNFLILFVLFVIAYIVNHMFDEVTPGNFWGLTYGTVATILFVAVAYYGVRRRTMSISSKLKMGSSNFWLQVHLYGGVLFLLLMFLHTTFNLPQSPFNWLLWSFSIWVVLSGIVGVSLQKWIPQLLSSALTIEVRADRIDELVEELRKRAEKEVASSPPAIKDFYERTIAPDMAKPMVRAGFFWDITGGIQSKIRQMDYLKQFLSEDDEEKLEMIEEIYRSKLECDAHYTLQKPLRVWLYTHLPTSLVLLTLIIIHLFIVFYY